MTPEEKDRFTAVFNADVVGAYWPFMRGLAHVALDELRAGVSAVTTSTHCGELNVGAARLLPLHVLLARDSTAEDMLRRYFMRFIFICDFHAWQAIDRKLACVLDRDQRPAVLDALRKVFDDPRGINGTAWADIKRNHSNLEQVTVALDTAELEVDSASAQAKASARMGFFVYIEDFWLCPRWWTSVSVRFRALCQRYGINTTNDIELFWYEFSTFLLHSF